MNAENFVIFMWNDVYLGGIPLEVNDITTAFPAVAVMQMSARMMMMSNVVGEKQGWVPFPLPRRVAKLDKPPPLRKATVKRDDNIAAVPSKEVDTIELKDDSSGNKILSSVTKISSIQEVAAKGNDVSQEAITRDVETPVRKHRLSRGLKLEKPTPLKKFINDESKDAVKKTTRPLTSISPASMAKKLIFIVKQEMIAKSEANNVPVSKKDITKPESHSNQGSSHPRFQSQMSADSGFGDDSSLPSLSRQSSNLSSVGENGDMLSFELHGQEKEVQDWDNQDEVNESFVIGPQLCSAANNTKVNKGPVNSIERWETKLNSSSKTTTADKSSGLSTTNFRNGNQYTQANSHSQLHNAANNTNTKVIMAVHGGENWEFDLSSMSQPNSYVTHSQFCKNISESENWEMDLIDVNNNGFYPKIEYSMLDKSIPNIYQKNAPRIPVAKMDWENEIYNSDTSPDDETLCHVQKMSSNMNENVGCPETRSKCDTDQFICVSDQSTPKANSVINTVCEKDLKALEIKSLSVYQDSYRSAESSYDTASSWSVSTEADGVQSCSTDEPLNETDYAWELIEDLTDRMQNISIHSPPERSPSPANHSSQSTANSLDKQIKFENVKTCMLPSCDKNIYLPDDKEHAWELIDKTSIVQHKCFNKSNSSSDKEALFSVMKDNSRRVLVHIREPISPSSSADFVQRVEGTMPGIPFSAKWRRKMFAKYMRTIDVEVILDGDVCILQYSIEQLVLYAKSPSSLTIPSEWSYLTKVFPEVCLSERLDFDPEKFLENYSKGNTMDRFRYCCEKTRNSQPNQYNTQDRGDSYSTDHRNKEWSITQPIRSGFGVPRQNSHEEFTVNINKEKSVTPLIRSGFGVPRQSSYEEFTANIHTEEKPVVTGRGGFGCRRQNSSDKLVPNISTESRPMSPPWGLPHKCPW